MLWTDRSFSPGSLGPMCGIVGYVGPQDARDVVLEGLRRLEYRGYDSAGIAVVADGELSSATPVGCSCVPPGPISWCG